MLTVVKIGWRECADTSRLESVLTYALHGLEYRAVDGAAFAEVCRSAAALPAGRAVLFAVALPAGGFSCEHAQLISALALQADCLDGWAGAVLVDGPGELFTKKIGRELIFMANQAGCAFPGKPLVEATGSLYNFNTQAMLLDATNLQAYKESAACLVGKTTAFAAELSRGRRPARRVVVLHASSRKTSNTLLLWEMIRKKLPADVDVEEISLRNGAVVDCRGCSYEACRHFGEKGECFYGGVIVERVYPAIRAGDAVVLICPNYNDAVSANITAFFNRLTALFRKDFASFSKKRVYALVVSGYSGGDIVAEQVIDAMNCNKNFALPPRFAMIETANDPNSILQCPGVEERAAAMARRIAGV